MNMNSSNGQITLVTGGAGFIGSHSVERLLSQGAKVRVLDNLSAGRRGNLPLENPRLELIEGDIGDPDTARAAMRGVARCLHLAAQVSVQDSVRDPANSARQNILGCVNVMQAAQEAGVEKFVFASSAAVYGNPKSLPLAEDAVLEPLAPYGLEKLVDEQYAALFRSLHGLPSLGLRYFNVYGPRQDPRSPYAGVISKFMDCLLAGTTPTIHGDGRQTRDFIYVKDVARTNVAALQSQKQGLCNVATGQQINLLDLLQVLRQVTESSTAARHTAGRDDDIRDSLGDTRRLQDWLGIEPEWTLSEGLRALVDNTVAESSGSGAT